MCVAVWQVAIAVTTRRAAVAGGLCAISTHSVAASQPQRFTSPLAVSVAVHSVGDFDRWLSDDYLRSPAPPAALASSVRCVVCRGVGAAANTAALVSLFPAEDLPAVRSYYSQTDQAEKMLQTVDPLSSRGSRSGGVRVHYFEPRLFRRAMSTTSRRYETLADARDAPSAIAQSTKLMSVTDSARSVTDSPPSATDSTLGALALTAANFDAIGLRPGCGLMLGAHGLTVGYSLWQQEFLSEASDAEHAAFGVHGSIAGSLLPGCTDAPLPGPAVLHAVDTPAQAAQLAQVRTAALLRESCAPRASIGR